MLLGIQLKNELILEGSQLSLGREQSLPDFANPPHLFSLLMKGPLQFFVQRNSHVFRTEIVSLCVHHGCLETQSAWCSALCYVQENVAGVY